NSRAPQSGQLPCCRDLACRFALQSLLMLDVLDKELEKRGHRRVVRYPQQEFACPVLGTTVRCVRSHPHTWKKFGPADPGDTMGGRRSPVRRRDSMFRVDGVGTGIMLVDRTVFVTLASTAPQKPLLQAAWKVSYPVYGFFDCPNDLGA